MFAGRDLLSVKLVGTVKMEKGGVLAKVGKTILCELIFIKLL